MRSIGFINDRLAYFSLMLGLLAPCLSCNKLVQVANPISSITAAQTFSSDATAASAMLGIYSYMSDPSGPSFSNSQMTYYPGESADELIDESSGNEFYDHFLSNSLTAVNDGGTALGYFWQPAYYDIYCANAVVSGVQGSSGVSDATRQQLTGEAKFIRALCYFYLTNLYGDVPLDLSTNFNQTVLLPKTPQEKVYQQIISDLQDAEGLMIGDFSLSNGQPIRPNKWAASALLARVYLFEKNWDSAYLMANAVINSRQFSLVPLPMVPSNGVPPSDSDVFAANSAESIFQLQTPNVFPYSTAEGNLFAINNLSIWLTPQLMGAFEAGDQRRANWVDSITEGSTVYYLPYKYKSSSITASSGNVTENYTVLRLAEQYLIRAEAEANGAGGGSSAAVQDLDTIRGRAGLSPLSPSLSGDSLMTAVQQEWRIEFFAEWGHRWLDLKRWGNAISTLGTIFYKEGKIDATQLLYPIAIVELQTDPNLVQNLGY